MGIWDWLTRMLGKKENMQKTNLILFGPPTGDLFRYEIGNKTPLGLKAQEYMDQGQLVPDEVTIGMLKNKVNSNPDVKGYIFDGFPRTTPQAEALDKFLKESGQKVSKLIALNVDRSISKRDRSRLWTLR